MDLDEELWMWFCIYMDVLLFLFYQRGVGTDGIAYNVGYSMRSCGNPMNISKSWTLFCIANVEEALRLPTTEFGGL